MTKDQLWSKPRNLSKPTNAPYSLSKGGLGCRSTSAAFLNQGLDLTDLLIIYLIFLLLSLLPLIAFASVSYLVAK